MGPDWFQVGQTICLPVALQEGGQTIALTTILFAPPGDGSFPRAVVHHGSTGSGRFAEGFDLVWFNAWCADVLNARGYLVAVPQRRGRGGAAGATQARPPAPCKAQSRR